MYNVALYYFNQDKVKQTIEIGTEIENRDIFHYKVGQIAYPLFNEYIIYSPSDNLLS